MVEKSKRIDGEWASLVPDGWSGWFGSGDLKEHSGERKMLYDLIEEDEHLEGLIGGKFGPDLQPTGGPAQIFQNRSLHKGVGVATDRRVIFLDKGIFSTEVMEFPYSSIESISYSTGILMGGLRIAGRGVTSIRIEMVQPKWSAKAFADVVRPHLTSHQNR